MDALGLQNVPFGRAWTLLVSTAENSDALFSDAPEFQFT